MVAKSARGRPPARRMRGGPWPWHRHSSIRRRRQASRAVSRQRSAITHQPSAVSRQPSAVSRQPSAVSRQPSAVSRQPSAVSPSRITPHALAPAPALRTFRRNIPALPLVIEPSSSEAVHLHESQSEHHGAPRRVPRDRPQRPAAAHAPAGPARGRGPRGPGAGRPAPGRSRRRRALTGTSSPPRRTPTPGVHRLPHRRQALLRDPAGDARARVPLGWPTTPRHDPRRRVRRRGDHRPRGPLGAGREPRVPGRIVSYDAVADSNLPASRRRGCRTRP